MAVPDTRLFLTDEGNTFSGLAEETISGGQLVKAVSGATVLSSTNALDNVIELMKVDAAGDEPTCVGLAITTGASGNRITVTTTGIHGLKAGVAVAAGQMVEAFGTAASADAVQPFTAGIGSKFIGRSLSTGASGQLVAIRLNV